MKLFAAFLLCLLVFGVRAQEPIPLWSDAELTPKPDPAHPEKKVDRDIGVAYSDVSVPTITIYPPPADKNTGCAVIICPGGGYGGLAFDWEGTDVAKWFNTQGVTGVVLKYRMPRPMITKDQTPLPLRDSRRAMQMIRSDAAKYKIDPHHIGIAGFSAGGHLAATTGTHLLAPDANAADPLDKISARPDFMILIYPVITFADPYAHKGSRTNLLGKAASAAIRDLYSAEKQVTTETPPTFLAHAVHDDGVSIENSRLFLAALNAHKIPAELCEFSEGQHGFGLGQRGGDPAVWPEQCIVWMKHQKLLGS